MAACKTQWAVFGHLQAGIIGDLVGGGTVAGNILVIALTKLAFVCAFPMQEIPYDCKCVKSVLNPLWSYSVSWQWTKLTCHPASMNWKCLQRWRNG